MRRSAETAPHGARRQRVHAALAVAAAAAALAGCSPSPAVHTAGAWSFTNALPALVTDALPTVGTLAPTTVGTDADHMIAVADLGRSSAVGRSQLASVARTIEPIMSALAGPAGRTVQPARPRNDLPLPAVSGVVEFSATSGTDVTATTTWFYDGVHRAVVSCIHPVGDPGDIPQRCDEALTTMTVTVP